MDETSTLSNSGLQDLLVVDDDPTIRELYTILLTEAGYRVWVARSVEAARELFREREFGIVICDVNLGAVEEDGRSLLAYFRDKPFPPCFIFLTGDTRDETIRATIEAGAFACLRKGIDLDTLQIELLAIVRRAQERMKFIQASPDRGIAETRVFH